MIWKIARTLGLLLSLSACSTDSNSKFSTEIKSATVVQLLTTPNTDQHLKLASSQELRFKTPLPGGLTVGTAVDHYSEFNQNQELLFVPASVIKLVLSAVLLESQGEDFRMSSEVSWAEDHRQPGTLYDLKISSLGDPTWGDRQAGFDPLEGLIEIFKLRDVQQIAADIEFVSLDSRWSLPEDTPGLDPRDDSHCYSSPAYDFNTNLNCGTIFIRSLTDLDWQVPGAPMRLENELTAGDKTSVWTSPIRNAQGHIEGYQVQGSWAPDRTEKVTLDRPIYLAKAWSLEAFKARLIQAGVQLSDQPAIDPESLKSYRMRLVSPELAELIPRMNKESSNFYADFFFKWLGLRSSKANEGPRTLGARHFKAQIEAWFDAIERPDLASEVITVEGAGLSRANQLSPRALLHILKILPGKAYFPVIWQSLPIAGEDGTLSDRLRQSPARKWVRAKTGTLSGYYQLAGYIPELGPNQKIKNYIPFVILTKAEVSKKDEARAYQDELVTELFERVNGIESDRALP